MTLPRDPKQRKLVILSAAAISGMFGLLIFVAGVRDNEAGIIFMALGAALAIAWFVVPVWPFKH